MAIARETIDKLKGLSVSSVLEGEGVYLKRVGREFLTYCLWHKDTNPSLTINDSKGFVFCHVCQHHDDAIGFIQKKHGLPFREACERIAAKINIPVIFEDENDESFLRRKQEIEAEYRKAEELQAKYRKALKEYPCSVEFIKSRGIAPETSKFFGLGYNYNESRVTIPISDYKGRIVGFTGRTIERDFKPKYKNTENNLIFNKSNIVFNEFGASDAIREKECCVFVEGHLDVIKLWQSGVKNAVALQGTATPSFEVIKRLMRKTNCFVLCMDSDQGGNLAIGKFLKGVESLALSGELEIKVASLPKGMDPDEFIDGGGNISSVIDQSVSWMDWILDEWLGQVDFNNKSLVQEVETKIKELFSRIGSPALRAHYYDKASIRLAQNKQLLAAEIVKSFYDHGQKQKIERHWQKPSREFTRKLVEKRAVRLYINSPEFRWILKPLMVHLTSPSIKWLWERVCEVEDICEGVSLADTLLALLCVSESQYMQKLRTVVKPLIVIDDNELSVSHIEEIMMSDIFSTDPAV
jgi:DNA primase